jgi:hypothetical protein
MRRRLVRFPDGLAETSRHRIFCREPDEQETAVTLLPEAVIEILSKGYEAKDLESGVPFLPRMGVKDIVVLDPDTNAVLHYQAGHPTPANSSHPWTSRLPAAAAARCENATTMRDQQRQPQQANDPLLLDAMEAAGRFVAPPEKASVALAEGKVGKAVRLAFADECRNVFVNAPSVKGSPAWDRAAGFSFWVRGDGSDHLGGLQFVWDGDYARRYGYAFPIDSRDWQKIVVPWRDLVPELSRPLPPLTPSAARLRPVSVAHFGKWWYWRDYARHEYVVDEIAWSPESRSTQPVPADRAPLARASQTPGRQAHHGRHHGRLADRHGPLVQPGKQLARAPASRRKRKIRRQCVRHQPGHRRHGTAPQSGLAAALDAQNARPDLVTIFFGYNDASAGMDAATFRAAQTDAVERIRRATRGRSDVLILTTCPAPGSEGKLAKLAEACRQAARQTNAGLADVQAAFATRSPSERSQLYASDNVHLGLAGHVLVAQTVLRALEGGGR